MSNNLSKNVHADKIANDFNNMLTIVFSNLELFKETKNFKEREQYINKALAEYDLAVDISNELITFSKSNIHYSNLIALKNKKNLKTDKSKSN